MTKMHELADLGQAVWLDFIRRSLITSGDLQSLVDEGLRGMTSNPSIFEKAIAGSDDYDQALEALVRQGRTVDEIYEALAVEDIQRAADVLRPVYDETEGADGYVSLEVNPKLARDTEGTIAEAERLFAAVDRPNVLIKVPATPEGVPAIETLIGGGVNVNVTLMFSLDHYEAVSEAYLRGLERRAATGGDLSQVASVASFFVSRVDTAVDEALAEAGHEELQGKIAIANSKVTYARFKEVFSGPRWQKLVAQGARVQRPLWASTSTKNPAYPDTLYVDSLIGPNTVNTLPPATLEVFRDHGTVALTLEAGLDEARADLARLAEVGVDLGAITDKLQDRGVAAFAESFDSLLAGIEKKCGKLKGTSSGGSPEAYQRAAEAALEELAEEGIVARIWNHDHTVWKPEPKEITNRLGWLHIVEAMKGQLSRLDELVASVRQAGYRDVLLLGMGGSSLAPEVFSHVFGREDDPLHLKVLDSTDPGAVLAHAGRLDPEKTLFIVATKSGSTVETLSFFKFFYNWTADALGADRAGAHFVGITDPGSKLVALAEEYDFREVFLNEPNIGGRYSVLSYFGLVPAALVGVEVETLLERAAEAVAACKRDPAGGENPGAGLGAVLGELTQAGRDKVTFVASPPLANFADWIEQLIAESTGKDGTGILPVVGEPPGPPDAYRDDRVFVYLRLDGDETHDAALQALEDAGQPVILLRLRDRYDLGQQFFLWEFAVAVAGHRLGIQPFNQPNVESAKVRAREMVAAYQESGSLPPDEPAPLEVEVLLEFLDRPTEGSPAPHSGQSYVALQAYVQPTAESDAALQVLRTGLRDRFKLATTVGYGPRFLHSTGQLHKGDAGHGLFVQFTSDAGQDAPIPDQAGSSGSSITFGVLKMAQALGDKQALEDAGRRVIRFHLGRDVVGGLGQLAGGVSA